MCPLPLLRMGTNFISLKGMTHKGEGKWQQIRSLTSALALKIAMDCSEATRHSSVCVCGCMIEYEWICVFFWFVCVHCDCVSVWLAGFGNFSLTSTCPDYSLRIVVSLYWFDSLASLSLLIPCLPACSACFLLKPPGFTCCLTAELYPTTRHVMATPRQHDVLASDVQGQRPLKPDFIITSKL